MPPSPSPPTGAPPSAADANEAIRRFVRARRGRSWTDEDRAEYARLLEIWTLAVRGAVVEVV
ncbi:hypothetical protein [Streptomyces sp. CB02923]|uniref:hypothetical protein n=1 Tax=Streptomyces sp. CB02923 TaxID=1718985 RepID=UPI00093B385C|nr:hypothetical protein [Streptomyces sp. CB02923]